MSAAAGIVIWGHALAALAFAALGLWTLRLKAKAMPRIPFGLALFATALWGLAIAGMGSGEAGTQLAHGLRDLAWLAVLLLLHRTARPDSGLAPVGSVHAVVALVAIAAMLLRVFAGVADEASVRDALTRVALPLSLMTAIAGLWLVQALVRGLARRSHWAIALLPAALWSFDILLLLLDAGSPAVTRMEAVRGVLLILAGAVVGIALHRPDQWDLRISRSLAIQSLLLLLAGTCLVGVVAGAGMIAQFGGGRALQAGFVVGAMATAVAALSNPRLLAWAKVKLAKHFYRHRYDYRAEWIRFTETLGDAETPLSARVVKAVADLTDSPGGLLMLPDGGRLYPSAAWGWDGVGEDARAIDAGMLARLSGAERVIEIDAVREGRCDPNDRTCVPDWMLASPDAWTLVPLPRGDVLAGAILLARPPVDRPLDWEDFDLFRIAGRQVASHLAEARAQEALMEAQRFDEFNRRFAFILHDIKNLVSQLSLVARNAERHADNPAFRADMVATLTESAGRMNGLLARLSQHHRSPPASSVPVALIPLAERVAARRASRHPVLVTGDVDVLCMGDAARIEQILDHLVQNAIDASPQQEAVILRVGQDGSGATIDVTDRGCGMSPDFVRDRLFKPFDSTKAGGFGIGAFEARQLAEAMHGELSVRSREGEGTRFRLTLESAQPKAMDAAA